MQLNPADPQIRGAGAKNYSLKYYPHIFIPAPGDNVNGKVDSQELDNLKWNSLVYREQERRHPGKGHYSYVEQFATWQLKPIIAHLRSTGATYWIASASNRCAEWVNPNYCTRDRYDNLLIYCLF